MSIVDGGRKLDAARKHFNNSEYPDCIARCQECIELSIKCALNSAGINYERKHEVSDRLMEICRKFDRLRNAEFMKQNEGRRIEKFLIFDIPKLRLISLLWLNNHILQLTQYGYESAEPTPISPINFIRKKEAELALFHAEHTFSVCNELICYGDLYLSKY